MQPPKVNSKLAADDLARDAAPGDKPAGDQRDTSLPASEDNADTDAAKGLADAQERVVERGLTRLPPG